MIYYPIELTDVCHYNSDTAFINITQDLDLDKEITHLDHDVEVTEQFRSNDMKLIQHKGDLFCLEAMTKQRHEKKENQKFQVFPSIQT